MRPGRTSKTYLNHSFPDLAPALCGATTGHRPRRACRRGQGNDGPISTLRVLRERSNRQAATALIAYADWRAALGSPVLPRRGALRCSRGTPPGNLPDRRPKSKNPIFSYWCGREDSNLHGLPRYPLKVVRLPIPPRPLSYAPEGQPFSGVSDCRTKSKQGRSRNRAADRWQGSIPGIPRCPRGHCAAGRNRAPARASKLPWRCVSTEAPSALEQWVQWGGPSDLAAASIRSRRLWPSIEKNDMAPHVSLSGGHGIDVATAQRSPHVGASSAASFAGP